MIAAMARGIVKPIVNFSARVKPDDVFVLVGLGLGLDGCVVNPTVRQVMQPWYHSKEVSQRLVWSLSAYCL